MAYTSANLSWAKGQVPDHNDLNRIEANIEAGVFTNTSFRWNEEIVQLTNVLTQLTAYSTTHTSRTGRIKVSVSGTYRNTGAALNYCYIGLTINGGLSTGGVIGIDSVPVNEWRTLYFSVIELVTPGSNLSVAIAAAYATGGAGYNFVRGSIVVEDI